MNWTKQKSKQKSEYVTKYPKVAQNGMLDEYYYCNKSAICLNTSDTEREFIYQFPVWKSP